jgi:hypothetical protein
MDEATGKALGWKVQRRRLSASLREGEAMGLPYEIDESMPGAKPAPKADKCRVKLDPFTATAIRL